jgi:hypothetical protein
MQSASSNTIFPLPRPFPPEQRQNGFNSLLREIASVRAVTRRGKRNPRGVKRKVSYFILRKRGHPLNQPCLPLEQINLMMTLYFRGIT